ncbi:MAG: hypothetical protein KQH57_13800 [Actinomycetales bacterium]|nr:hypothetical protein [Actinomycetales bacterium]
MTLTDQRAPARDPATDDGTASLLWPRGPELAWDLDDDTWHDLGLATLVDGAPEGSDRARLARVWRRVPTDRATVTHRQDVTADLERPAIADAVIRFTADADRSRSQLAFAAQVRHPPQQHAWVLAAVTVRGRAVERLAAALRAAAPGSAGLLAVRAHLEQRLADPAERGRRARAEALTAELADLRYVLRVAGDRVGVSADAGQRDATAPIAETFERFRQREPDAHPAEVGGSAWLSHVEEAVIDRVAALHPELFGRLAAFAATDLVPDPVLERFDDEVRSFLAYRALVAPLRAAGLPLCRPVLDTSGRVDARGTYDLALADRLVAAGDRVVRNDLTLDPGERVVVVTGPNQGGKTTLARTVGQLHVLAALGLEVPGGRVRLAVPDTVRTVFGRQEDVADRRSALEDDLLRTARALDACTARSVVIANELFSSTAPRDAAVLGERVLRRVLAAGSLGVYVTFLDELARLDPAVVSMTSTVDPDDPAVRTFRVVRAPADGRAYAIALAARYGLTRDQVLERIHDARRDR